MDDQEQGQAQQDFVGRGKRQKTIPKMYMGSGTMPPKKKFGMFFFC